MGTKHLNLDWDNSGVGNPFRAPKSIPTPSSRKIVKKEGFNSCKGVQAQKNHKKKVNQKKDMADLVRLVNRPKK